MSLGKENSMKRYRIREGSPAWCIKVTFELLVFIALASLPSTIETFL